MNIWLLKGLIYDYLEDKLTFSFIDKLRDFFNAINSRTNRPTNLAANEGTTKDVPRLLFFKSGTVAETSLPTEALRWWFCKDNKTIKQNKYKQSFTDAVFEMKQRKTKQIQTIIHWCSFWIFWHPD